MESEYERRQEEEGSRTDRSFWFSLLSAVAVLAIVGLFLYAAQLNNQTSNGVQPGVGGGPGTVTSPTPSPIPDFSPPASPIPTPSPVPIP
ncbi:MAG: hypothetical protein NUV73_02830 [Candidatus Daviesbacteria bacterium]|nr:hypothetical protein [Candidatus Daviesbacteria bacterium]